MPARLEPERQWNAVFERLADLLGMEERVLRERAMPSDGGGWVFNLGTIFVLAMSRSTAVAPMAAAVRKLRQQSHGFDGQAVPIMVVPFMGDAGKRACLEEQVGWFDLSGNAHIVAPGLRIHIEGKSNRFKTSGRPANLFAPRSTRVVRWLLIHAGESIRQRELARATELDEGFVSRLVTRLESEELVERDPGGAVRARNPALLLDLWRETVGKSKPPMVIGHVAARSGDGLLRFLAEAFLDAKLAYAATGLAAAWAYTHFASFRSTTIYLPVYPSTEFLKHLGFLEEPRGANLRLVIPRDDGVFLDIQEPDGIRCVHPVQAYVDLKSEPERSEEAAQRIRTEYLNWSQDDR